MDNAFTLPSRELPYKRRHGVKAQTHVLNLSSALSEGTAISCGCNILTCIEQSMTETAMMASSTVTTSLYMSLECAGTHTQTQNINSRITTKTCILESASKNLTGLIYQQQPFPENVNAPQSFLEIGLDLSFRSQVNG